MSLFRVMTANAKEWWLILLGVLCSFVLGSIFPLFAVVFRELLEVFTLPRDQILDRVHVWGGAFIALGVVSGIAVFIRVSRENFVFFVYRFLFVCCSFRQFVLLLLGKILRLV